MRDWIARRPNLGFSESLVRELAYEGRTEIRTTKLCMDTAASNELLGVVGPLIVREDTTMRTSISPRQTIWYKHEHFSAKIATKWHITSCHNYYKVISKQTRSSADADNPRDAFRGQSRSPNMVPFDMLGMVSYLVCYGNFVLRRAFFQYSTSKMSWAWNPGQRSLKVIESGTIRKIEYGFLLVFYRNYAPKRYLTSKMPWPWHRVRGPSRSVEIR